KSTAALKSSMTLSMPNASNNKLFDAQPSSSDAAPSMVIQPSVMYVSNSANRTSSERSRMRHASVVSGRRSSVLAGMVDSPYHRDYLDQRCRSRTDGISDGGIQHVSSSVWLGNL